MEEVGMMYLKLEERLWGWGIRQPLEAGKGEEMDSALKLQKEYSPADIFIPVETNFGLPVFRNVRQHISAVLSH